MNEFQQKQLSVILAKDSHEIIVLFLFIIGMYLSGVIWTLYNEKKITVFDAIMVLINPKIQRGFFLNGPGFIFLPAWVLMSCGVFYLIS